MAPTQPRSTPGRKEVAQPMRKVGRPRTTHSDPNYRQMSIYIPKDVRSRVKMRLFETGGEAIRQMPGAQELVVITNDDRRAQEAALWLVNAGQRTAILVADECSLQ